MTNIVFSTSKAVPEPMSDPIASISYSPPPAVNIPSETHKNRLLRDSYGPSNRNERFETNRIQFSKPMLNQERHQSYHRPQNLNFSRQTYSPVYHAPIRLMSDSLKHSNLSSSSSRRDASSNSRDFSAHKSNNAIRDKILPEETAPSLPPAIQVESEMAEVEQTESEIVSGAYKVIIKELSRLIQNDFNRMVIDPIIQDFYSNHNFGNQPTIFNLNTLPTHADAVESQPNYMTSSVNLNDGESPLSKRSFLPSFKKVVEPQDSLYLHKKHSLPSINLHKEALVKKPASLKPSPRLEQLEVRDKDYKIPSQYAWSDISNDSEDEYGLPAKAKSNKRQLLAEEPLALDLHEDSYSSGSEDVKKKKPRKSSSELKRRKKISESVVASHPVLAPPKLNPVVLPVSPIDEVLLQSLKWPDRPAKVPVTEFEDEDSDDGHDSDASLDFSNLDLITGLAGDERRDEDLKFLHAVALEEQARRRKSRESRGKKVNQSPLVEELFITFGRHRTGSARTEGYYRIPQNEKYKYLIHTEKQTPVPLHAEKPVSKVQRKSLTSSSIPYSAIYGDSAGDVIKYNMMRSRGTRLRFARSKIHDWGLFALEPIEASEIVIEYIGELIRQKVADHREKYYEKSGIGSSYLFRIDEDNIIDATKAGNLARFINHCCDIINVDGVKKIVIYANRNLDVGEEVTYDYKFPIEEDKIPCLCGAKVFVFNRKACRGYLN